MLYKPSLHVFGMSVKKACNKPTLKIRCNRRCILHYSTPKQRWTHVCYYISAGNRWSSVQNISAVYKSPAHQHRKLTLPTHKTKGFSGAYHRWRKSRIKNTGIRWLRIAELIIMVPRQRKCRHHRSVGGILRQQHPDGCYWTSKNIWSRPFQSTIQQRWCHHKAAAQHNKIDRA